MGLRTGERGEARDSGCGKASAIGNRGAGGGLRGAGSGTRGAGFGKSSAIGSQMIDAAYTGAAPGATPAHRLMFITGETPGVSSRHVLVYHR